MKGTILFSCPIKCGLVKIGVPECYTLDMKNQRTKWKVEGTIIVNGTIIIGSGCCIRLIGNDSQLSLGNNFIITGRFNIICQKQVVFGNDCLLSWDILIMDTDFHQIVDEKKNVINQPSPIIFGNHIWIGCRSTILKGVNIADNMVIASCSIVTRSLSESNCIYGGNAKSINIIKQNINWKY